MDGERVKWLNEADEQLTTETTRVTPVRYTASSLDLSLRPRIGDVLKAVESHSHNANLEERGVLTEKRAAVASISKAAAAL